MAYKNLPPKADRPRAEKISISITRGLFLAFIFLLFMFSDKVLAYSPETTHRDLTREIITFYELSTAKKFTDEQRQWTILGSAEEDRSPRWLNHFYDPVFERGLQAESVSVSGYLAKNWAQFSSYQTISPLNIGNLWSGKGPVISGSWWGDFSYEAAIKDYSKNKEKESYIALGHILHLIEDITVPEHTRNDPHPGGNDTSFYEDWTKNNSSGLTQDLGKRIYNQGRKPIIYSDLESYFNNLATYTNSHFFSPRTINSKLYQKPKIVFEDDTFAYGQDENGEFYDLFIENKTTGLKTINNKQILQEYWLRLSRQAVLNGAGVIDLFLREAEKAKEAELTRQELEKQNLAKKSSFLSQIFNFFRSPKAPTNEPALVIKSEPRRDIGAQPTKPKVIKQETTVKQIEIKKSEIVQPKPAPVPQINAPIVYGNGGGGGGTGSSLNSLTQQEASSNSSGQVNSDQSSNTQQTATSTDSGQANNTDNSSNTQTFSVGDLIINEIMYDLSDVADKDHEWIEIFNPGNKEINFDGGKLYDGDGETNSALNTPPKNGGQGSIVIAAGGYAILASKADVFLTDHTSFGGTVIDTVLDLKNSEDTIRLLAPDGTILDEVTYSSSWGADGNGKTLERKSANGGSSDAANWGVSSANGGTPGTTNNWLLTTLDVVTDTATSTPEVATSTEPIVSLGTDISATTTIMTSATWTLAGSPYRLFFDTTKRPTVAAGAALTIAPGVKIIPQGGGATIMEIQGTLNAIATSGAPIIFTSIADADSDASTTPQKGDWLNIVFSQGSQANLDYVEFRYGGGQDIVLPLHEMVNIVGAAVNISNSKFENSKHAALHLVDSLGTVQSSVFSDNDCGISIDSTNGIANVSYGGCYGIHTTGQVLSAAPQIKNNQFTRNQLIGIEVRSGAAPTIDNNIFTDNGYPIKIESSYPIISNSQIANSTSSPSILNGIAISGYTHFSQNYTLKKDLPYILETNGPALSPYVDASTILTVEQGVILKTGHTFTALNINGSLVASTTSDNPIVFTSLKDDTGGDTNNDSSASSPQNNDWAHIKFFSASVGNLTNAIFNYGGFGLVPTPIVNNQLIADFPLSSDVLNQSCDVTTANISQNSNGVFSKVIISKLTNHNPIATAFFRVNVVGGGVVDQVLVQNPTYNNSEVELNFTAGFNAGSQYNVRFMGVTEGGDIAIGCDLGNDATGNLASAFYESVTTMSNPALSIDSGATVVVQ